MNQSINTWSRKHWKPGKNISENHRLSEIF